MKKENDYIVIIDILVSLYPSITGIIFVYVSIFS